MSRQVPGLSKLTANIKRKINKAKKGAPDGKAVVVVGYSEYYAIFVHEDLKKYHPVGKAKYLTDPLHAMKTEIAKMINRLMRRGSSLPQALLIVGERLQRKSQREVPVDTGVLQASAYTKLEKGSP